MKLQSFYLFYLLAVLLLIFGILTKDVVIFASSHNMTIIRGMWPFFIPLAIVSLLTALIYHFKFYSSRILNRSLVITHFFLVVFGILFSLNIYRLIIVITNAGAPDTGALGGNSFIYIFLGPLLLIASLIVFIVSLINAKRKHT